MWHKAWRVFPLELKNTAPLGIVETGFQKDAGESTKIVETGSKTREGKCVDYTKWGITGFAVGVIYDFEQYFVLAE